MRISDWSSDVCSSDLLLRRQSLAHDPQPVSARLYRAIQLRQHPEVVHAGSSAPVRRPRGGAELDDRRLLPEQPSAYRSEEHTSELQSLMRISYAVFCLKKNTKQR